MTKQKYSSLREKPYHIVLDVVNFVTSEPVAPNKGNTYLNTTVGVSSITGQTLTAFDIVTWNGTNWTAESLVGGEFVYSEVGEVRYTFNGSSLVTFDTNTYATAAEIETGTEVAKVLNPLESSSVFVKKSIVNAKGDVITASADNTPTIISVGTNGQVLSADSTEASGLKWIDSSVVPENIVYSREGIFTLALASVTKNTTKTIQQHLLSDNKNFLIYNFLDVHSENSLRLVLGIPTLTVDVRTIAGATSAYTGTTQIPTGLYSINFPTATSIFFDALSGASTSTIPVNFVDFLTGGVLGIQSELDNTEYFNLAQTTVGQTFTLLNPSATASGKKLFVKNTGTATFSIYGQDVAADETVELIWNGVEWSKVGAGLVQYEGGANTAITTAQTTTSTTFVDVAGGSIPLTSAGKWSITYNISTQTSGQEIHYFRVVNSAGVEVANSIAYNQGFAPGARFSTSMTIPDVTTTGAETYRLQWRVNQGTGTIRNLTGAGVENTNSTITWTKLSGFLPVQTLPLDRISVHISTPQTANLAIGDHIKYNAISYTEGVGNITLDTSSAYTATGNANSIGRFSLKAGYTYSLRAYSGFEFSTASAAGAIVWRNADTGAEISTRTQANNFSQGGNINNSANVEVFFKPTIDTRVEVMLINAANITNIGQSWASVEQLA